MGLMTFSEFFQHFDARRFGLGQKNVEAEGGESDVVHVKGVVERDQVAVGADPPERESHALGRGLLVVAVA
jgi:hypothetical protein